MTQGRSSHAIDIVKVTSAPPAEILVQGHGGLIHNAD